MHPERKILKVSRFGLSDAVLRKRYDSLFEECSGAFVQQGTAWADAIRVFGPDEPVFVLAERDGQPVAGLPLYLFRTAVGNLLSSVPQAGPLGGVFAKDGECSGEIYSGLLSEAVRIARECDCLALTLITNPISDDCRLYEQNLSTDFIYENFTQIVDVESAVRDDKWILPDNADRNPGRTIRKAESSGLTSRVSDDPADFEVWYTIHERRHRELGLIPLPKALLKSILARLGPQGRAFLVVVTLGPQIVSGCIFVRHLDVCDAFIMSMDTAFRAQAPNYVLTRDALMEMARRGVRVLNWQSSARRDDGVYSFKKQWGSRERKYYFITKLFGSEAILTKLGESGARKMFPGHFLVPFGAFAAGLAKGRYAKA